MRAWCITTFKPELQEAPHNLFQALPEKAKFVIWQQERCPDTQRVHMHIYIRFAEPVRFAAVQKLINDMGAHCEPRRGTEKEAADYCRKEDSRIAGPWFFGQEAQGQGDRTDLHAALEMVKAGATNAQIAEAMPEVYARNHRGIQAVRCANEKPLRRDAMKIILLLGPTGIGKTTQAHRHWPNAFKPMYPSDSKVWFDGYEGQDTVIFDEIDEWHTSKIAISTVFQYLDPFPLIVPIKGSSTSARWTTVILTANLPPTEWFPYAPQAKVDALVRRIPTILTGSTFAELEQAVEHFLNPPPDPRDPIVLSDNE